MSRGYRSYILALVGWLILANTGAGPPHKAEIDNQAAEQRQQAPAPPTPSPQRYRPHAEYNQADCYRNTDHDAADLCAQWRAAVAAEKAAHRSLWANWINIGGALLSFASVILVLMALRQGREANRINMKEAARNTRRNVSGTAGTEKALGIARDNANAATALVDLSARNSEAQLRAYLASVTESFTRKEPEGTDFRLVFDFKNAGQTPAHGVTICHKGTWVPIARGSPAALVDGETQMGTVAPQTPVHLAYTFELGKRRARALETGRGCIRMLFTIPYTDAFNLRWLYTQSLLMYADSLETGLAYTEFCKNEQVTPEDEANQGLRLEGADPDQARP